MPEGVGSTTAPKETTTASSRGDRRALSLRCKPTRWYPDCCITLCYQGESTLILAPMRSPRPLRRGVPEDQRTPWRDQSWPPSSAPHGVAKARPGLAWYAQAPARAHHGAGVVCVEAHPSIPARHRVRATKAAVPPYPRPGPIARAAGARSSAAVRGGWRRAGRGRSGVCRAAVRTAHPTGRRGGPARHDQGCRCARACARRGRRRPRSRSGPG